jgi:hypothetical protein
MKCLNKENLKPDKNLAAVCGLFCGSCALYYSTQENNEQRLKKISENTGIPFSEIKCDGCRSSRVTGYCKKCFMFKCAADKGLDFCGECKDYPCEHLKAFQAERPHRAELWKAQARIKQTGWKNWFNEMLEYFSCKSCGTLNGAYDAKCRNCGETPGNDFVKNNSQ